MGVTGLETAFAVLHTGLVDARAASTWRLLVERLTSGGAPFGFPAPALAKGAPANVTLVDLDGRVGGGRGRLREPLGQLRLRTAAASPAACG